MEKEELEIDRLILKLKEMIASGVEVKEIKVVQQTLDVLLKEYLKEKI